MQQVFFDSSALIKYYKKDEKGCDKVWKILNSKNRGFSVTWLTIAEVINVLKCRLNGKELIEALDRLIADISGQKFAIFSPESGKSIFDVTRQVEEYKEKYNIDLVDAYNLHFIDSEFRKRKYTPKPLIVCSDKKLNKAFEELGWEVCDP